MAKKKKKADEKGLDELVSDLITEVGEDRQRIVKFLDELLTQYGGDKTVGIAEYVAKLIDAMTRQHQVKASTIKALIKKPSDTDDEYDADLDDLSKAIGKPFEIEDTSGDGN